MNFDLFFDLSDEIMSVTSLDGTIKKVNRAFEFFSGYSNIEIAEKSFYSFLHPDDVEFTLEKFHEIYSSKEKVVFENRILCKNGDYKWLKWYKILFERELAYSIALNIHEKKSENKILQSLQNWNSKSSLLNSILNTIPEYICLLDDNLQFLYLNNTAAKRMNSVQEDCIGKTVEEVDLKIQNLEEYKNEIRNVLSTGVPFTNIISVKVKEVVKDIEYSIIPVKENENIFGAIYIAKDLTASNKARRDFEASQIKLKRIIDLVPYPIFLKDEKYRYTLCNQAQVELFDTTFENLIGKSDENFLNDSQILEEINSSDKKIIEQQISVVLAEQTITNATGISKILHTTKIPFFNESDNTINILGISIDITSIKHSEEELMRINFELDSFVYKSSHDLRAPLRSLIGLLNLARKEKDPKMLNEILDRSNKSIAKLDNFISDLTNFSRNSRLDIASDLINFDFIIKECIENLKFMENAANIKINVTLDVKKEYYSDSNRISILFMNLISNAIKYHNSEKESQYVNIKVNNTKEGSEIIIEDNGIGIEKEFHNKVFDMFFRASEKSFGSGLGLYIVKQVVDKLSGTLKMESEYGEGSRFIIFLPNPKR